MLKIKYLYLYVMKEINESAHVRHLGQQIKKLSLTTD